MSLRKNPQTKPPPHIQVFGDESLFKEIAAYALVIVPTVIRAKVEYAMADAKIKFGGQPSNRIHCRELFHPDARARGCWKHLSSEEVFSFLENVATGVNSAGARCWVGLVDRTSAPAAMFFEAPGKADVLPINSAMHLTQFSYMTAAAPVIDLFEHEKVSFVLDPDASRLDWFGQRRKAKAIKGFFPTRHNDNRFEPTPIVGEKPLLLDLADIVAYCAAHLSSSSPISFRAQMETVAAGFRPGLSVAHFNIANGGPMMRAEVNSVAIDQFRSHFKELLAGSVAR